MPNPISPLPCSSIDRMKSDLKSLCRNIGERRAGGPNEARAVQFISKSFENAGSLVVREPVPCRCLVSDRSSVMVKLGKNWRGCQAHGLVGSPPTTRGEAAEGEIVWLEYPEATHRLGPNSLRGKIAALFGPLPTDIGLHKRLMEARPAAVMHIDDRLPFPWAKSDAFYPYWVQRFGAPPTVSVPYRAAWNWRIKGVTRARVAVVTRHAQALSFNVIATLPGSDPTAPSVLLSAHHDTQPFNTGADDNASGVVCILELARLLAKCPGRLRTIRFVSFGAEEQLSVGSTNYTHRHRRELDGIGLVINFDGVSSPLGHNWLMHSGKPGLAALFQASLQEGGYETVIKDEISPFGDHFPFTVYGVPALCLGRPNVHGGLRWQHHSSQDSLINTSADQVRALVLAIAAPILGLVRAHSLPFGRKASPKAVAQTSHLARTLFGLRA